MTASDPDTLVYAGVGSRSTPQNVLDDMTTMSGWLSRTGWHLSSGGADGADTAFAQGAPADQRTIYLPWNDYNGHAGPDCILPKPADLAACMKVAEQHHPTWDRCSQGARKLHARNAAILLGPSLDRPVNAVVCWTPGGEVTGGTGMALRIAAQYDIPVLNLAAVTPRQACEQLLAIRNQHEAQTRTRELATDAPGPAQTYATAETRLQPARNDSPDDPRVEYRTPSIVNLKDHPDAVANGAIRIDRQTEWSNPFKIGEHGSREEVIALYQEDLWKRIKSEQVSLAQLAALDGKTLACSANDCHGEILSRAATWAAARIELDNNQSVSKTAAHSPSPTPTENQPSLDSTIDDSERLSLDWTNFNNLANSQYTHPLALDGYQELVERARDINEFNNSNNISDHDRFSIVTQILEYDDACKAALSDIHEFNNNADKKLVHLADLKEKIPSCNLTLDKLEPHIWLNPADKLQAQAETILFTRDENYDACLERDPALWQTVHDKLLALSQGCAAAGGQATDYLKHHELYLPPLPASLTTDQDENYAHAQYRYLRNEWHFHIDVAENENAYAFDHNRRTESVDTPLNEIMDGLDKIGWNPHTPDHIKQHLKALCDNHFDYQRTKENLLNFAHNADQALHTYQTYVNTVNDPSTTATHFYDIDGFETWQANTEKLADKAEIIALYHSEEPENELYFKINPDAAKRTLETVAKLRDAAFDDQFDTPRQQLAKQQDANEDETHKRSMRM